MDEPEITPLEAKILGNETEVADLSTEQIDLLLALREYRRDRERLRSERMVEVFKGGKGFLLITRDGGTESRIPIEGWSTGPDPAEVLAIQAKALGRPAGPIDPPPGLHPAGNRRDRRHQLAVARRRK